MLNYEKDTMQETQKHKFVKKWIKKNPEATFRKFDAEYPKSISPQYFSVLRGKVLTGIQTKTQEAELPETLSIPKNQAGASMATDAGLLLQSAIKVWIDRGSGNTQLRTVTSGIIREYNYIKKAIENG